MQCNATQRNATQRNAIQYNAMQCNTMQHNQIKIPFAAKRNHPRRRPNISRKFKFQRKVAKLFRELML